MTDAEHNFQDTRERYGVGVTQLAQVVVVIVVVVILVGVVV